MTQLLISVKNVQEASIALAAGVDIIDLKDPNVGALGALDLEVTKQIVRLVNGGKLVSATVGELHTSVDELVHDIQTRADVGVNIIKIAVSSLFQAPDFYEKLFILTKSGLKIVAVFFADELPDFTILPVLKQVGFYGAMMDTKNKQQDLLQVQNQQSLHLFTQQCHHYQLTSGLAGSLQPQHIDLLLNVNATFIGFRGGVCDNSQRKSALNDTKLNEVQNVLRNGNRKGTKVSLILGLALHS